MKESPIVRGCFLEHAYKRKPYRIWLRPTPDAPKKEIELESGWFLMYDQTNNRLFVYRIAPVGRKNMACDFVKEIEL